MSDQPDVLLRPAPPPDVTESYGPHPDQVIDVRLPRDGTAPAPLVVILHGGFWRARYDRTYAGAMANALAEEGYVVAVPEYRRVGQDGGGWPGTFDDVAAALDAVPDLVAPHGADLGRVVYTGHSAGGHLALWAAARHRLPPGSPWRTGEPPRLRRVVPIAGCCDLAMCSGRGLGDGAADELMGGSPGECPDRYAQTDPAGLVPLGVPVTLVHGVDDVNVPMEVSREYANRARAAGDTVELREVPHADHFAVVDPLSQAWPQVLAAIAGSGQE